MVIMCLHMSENAPKASLDIHQPPYPRIQWQPTDMVEQPAKSAALVPEIFGLQPPEWNSKVLSKPLR